MDSRNPSRFSGRPARHESDSTLREDIREMEYWNDEREWIKLCMEHLADMDLETRLEKSMIILGP